MSGALEQINHMENGILVEPKIEKIADTVENYLENNALQEHLRENLAGFSQRKHSLLQWEQLIEGQK